MSIIKEFREFAIKGNVMDLAIGVIIGAAFGKIISSMVDSILMPVIGALLQGVNFQDYSLTIGQAVIKYGVFIGSVVDFLITAFVLFLFIKAINRLKRKEENAVPPAVVTKEQQLLTEIRDLLKKG